MKLLCLHCSEVAFTFAHGLPAQAISMQLCFNLSNTYREWDVVESWNIIKTLQFCQKNPKSIFKYIDWSLVQFSPCVLCALMTISLLQYWGVTDSCLLWRASTFHRGTGDAQLSWAQAFHCKGKENPLRSLKLSKLQVIPEVKIQSSSFQTKFSTS